MQISPSRRINASANCIEAWGAKTAAQHRDLGSAFESQERYAEAEHSYRTAIDLSGDLEAYNRLGRMLLRLGNPEHAALVFRQAIARSGERHAMLYTNLGAALSEAGQHDEALQVLHRAIELDPGIAITYFNVARSLTSLSCADQAEVFLRQALAIEPEFAQAKLHLAQLLLRKGEYAQGWRLFEARSEGTTSRLCAPARNVMRWRGQSLAGKAMLIVPEQGLGDCIQFMRYLPLLKAGGLRQLDIVIDASVRPLRRIFESIEDADALVDADAPQVGARYDYWCYMMSLPGLFGTTLTTIPARLPYICPSQEMVRAWGRRLPGGQPRVGLVWAGNPAHPADRQRSMHILQLLPLLKVAGITFVSLQHGGAAKAQLTQLPDGLRPIDLADDAHDLADTAAILANLDLLISVDTSTAHLAGALGRPVWLLSRYRGCWRWLDKRTDSPWYPGVLRLFRQPSPWDWTTPVTQMRRALLAFCKRQALA